MNGDFMDEKDWLDASPVQRERFTYRLLTTIHKDVKDLKRKKFATQGVCSLAGGIIGGFVAAFAHLKLKLFGL